MPYNWLSVLPIRKPDCDAIGRIFEKFCTAFSILPIGRHDLPAAPRGKMPK